MIYEGNVVDLFDADDDDDVPDVPDLTDDERRALRKMLGQRKKLSRRVRSDDPDGVKSMEDEIEDLADAWGSSGGNVHDIYDWRND